jgi:N-acetylmuramoyl-L-alanine amidase
VNKRASIVLIVSIAFLGASYTPIFEPTSPPTPLPEERGANSLLPPLMFGIKTVVIDAGHGGKDPGCLGITTSKEKDIALGIALKLGEYIQKKTPDVKVIFTRSTDVFIDLDERAAIANRNKADLFICIHCNTACAISKSTRKKVCNEEVFGTETYVMGLHKSNANLNVAKRENEAIVFEKNYQKRYDGFDNSDAAYILLSIQQNAFLKQSMNFAGKVQQQVKEKAGRVDKGVQQAGFLVLWRTAMPSVLIETEFISNTESEKFTVSEKGQDNMARAIFSAFRQYKDEVEGKYAKYNDDVENNAPFVPKKDTATIKDKGQGTKDGGHGAIEPKKDSIAIKKEPVIENETKTEIAPRDTVKNEIKIPTKKDSVKVSIPKDTVKQKPSENTPPQNGNSAYKVQFMSSGERIPLLSDKFKGLKDVGEYQDGNVYKYTAGEFKTFDEANKYRSEMASKGYKDCFVIRFKDGKRVKN